MDMHTCSASWYNLFWLVTMMCGPVFWKVFFSVQEVTLYPFLTVQGTINLVISIPISHHWLLCAHQGIGVLSVIWQRLGINSLQRLNTSIWALQCPEWLNGMWLSAGLQKYVLFFLNPTFLLVTTWHVQFSHLIEIKFESKLFIWFSKTGKCCVSQ